MKLIITILCTSSLYLLFGFQQQEKGAGNQTQDNKTITKPAPTASFSQDDTAKAASHFYLTRFSYTPETWGRLMKNPEDRRNAARQYIESVNGRLRGFWYAFGAYDGYCIWEAPDNVSMAAVGLAITGGGALSKFETTPLLTVEETLDALKRAQKIGYRQPGK
ncbi:MAG TPA: GYD domain-containing protein [Chitinophagaceae bacterium]|nr:GYD domain-containing protein [Chitinophagaceae bacterium]